MSSLSAILAASSGLLRPEKTIRRLREVVTQQELSDTRVPFRGELAAEQRLYQRGAAPGPQGSAGALVRSAQAPSGAPLGVAVDVLLLAARDAERSRRHVARDHR